MQDEKSQACATVDKPRCLKMGIHFGMDRSLSSLLKFKSVFFFTVCIFFKRESCCKSSPMILSQRKKNRWSKTITIRSSLTTLTYTPTPIYIVHTPFKRTGAQRGHFRARVIPISRTIPNWSHEQAEGREIRWECECMWVMRHEWFGVSRKTPKFTRCEKAGKGKMRVKWKVFFLCVCVLQLSLFFISSMWRLRKLWEKKIKTVTDRLRSFQHASH